MSVNQLLTILRARLVFLIAIPMAAAFVVLVVSLMMAPTYKAFSKLVINIDSPDPTVRNVPSNLFPLLVSTQIEIFMSDRVAIRAVELLQLDQVSAYTEAWLADTAGLGDKKLWIGSLLRRNIEVSPARDSNVLNITYSSAHAEESAKVVNAFTEAYQQVALEIKVQPAKQYVAWFHDQVGTLRDNYQQGLTTLTDYQVEHGIVGDFGKLDIETMKLSDMVRQLTIAQGQKVDTSSKQGANENIEVLQEVLSNPLISNMKTQMLQLEKQRSNAMKQLGVNHPSVRAIDAEIATVQAKIDFEVGQILSSIDSSGRITTAKIDELRQAIEAQKGVVLELRRHSDHIALLKQDIVNMSQAFELVNSGLSEVNLTSQRQFTNVSVLAWATPPLRPTGPSAKVNTFITFVLMMLITTGGIIAIELMFPKIRCEQDLQAVLPHHAFAVAV